MISQVSLPVHNLLAGLGCRLLAVVDSQKTFAVELASEAELVAPARVSVCVAEGHLSTQGLLRIPLRERQVLCAEDFVQQQMSNTAGR